MMLHRAFAIAMVVLIPLSLTANPPVATTVSDKESHIGEVTTDLKAELPVQTHLAMPPFLRLGDHGQIRLTIRNQDTKQETALKYTLTLPDGAQLDSPLVFERTLKPGEEMRDSRQLRIERLAAETVMKFEEKVDGFERSFNFEQKIKTLSNRAPNVEFILLRSPSNVVIQDDEMVSSASVTVTSGLMGAVIPSLRWLTHNPHGGVEQVANQTVPNLIIASLFMDAAGDRLHAADVSSDANMFQKAVAWTRPFLIDAWEWIVALIQGPTIERKVSKRYQKMIADAHQFGDAGLSRIADYQNPDGSFSWFADSREGRIEMTMFVLLSLLSTEHADWVQRVDINKAFNFLGSQNFPTGSPQKIMLAYLSGRLRALKITERTSESYEPNLRQQAEATLNEGGPLAKAYMLLALKDHGLKMEGDIARTVQTMTSSLLDDLNTAISSSQAQKGPWKKVSDAWPRYMGRDASNIAVVAHALHTYGKLNEALAQDVVRLLLAFFNGSHFGSTFETGLVLTHSTWLLKKEMKSRDRERQLRLRINGRTLTADDYDVVADLTGWNAEIRPTVFRTGSNAVQIENSDDFTTASLQLVREIPMERAQAASSGWMLKKTYFRVDKKHRRLEPIISSKVKVGDILYVRLDFGRTEDRNWQQSSYYSLRDDIPAGFSVIEDDKDLRARLDTESNDQNSSSRVVRKIHAENVQWSYQLDRGWMERPDQIGYFIKADFTGDYVTGVARIEDFYDERSFAQTKSDRLLVAPSGP